MEANGLHLSDLIYLAPELTLVIAAIVISLLDLFLPRHVSRHGMGVLTLIGFIISALFVCLHINPETPVQLLYGSYQVDDFGNLLKLVMLIASGLIVFMSLGSVNTKEIPETGEFYYLFLPATLGGMVLVSSGDLITLFVGLELLSLTSYILVGMRKNNKKSNEGAFKYSVLGGISSAIILYGMSFLYGITGTTNLSGIGQALAVTGGDFEAFIYLSFFLLLAGLGFKIAAAPFHTWAPDVYQGAQTSVTAFLAVVAKAAVLAFLFRLVYNVYLPLTELGGHISNDIFLALSVLAAAAMIVGNVGALLQKNVKRLLAYSGVANAGYLLVPIAVNFSLVHYSNYSEFLYYLIAYMFMTIGAFAVVLAVEKDGQTSELSGFAGLYHRAPWTAGAMVLIVLSLAGIPVSGGFFGKVFILLGALENHQYWIGAIILATSIISYYYYFGFVRQMFMRSNNQSEKMSISLPLAITIWLCVLGSVVMGLFPQWIVDYIQTVFSVTQDLIIQMG